MSTKIYVGNLAFNASEEEVRELFTPFGAVESVKLITDAQTGRPRGFGFVEMAAADEAAKAIEGLNGKTFMERNLTISEAKPQQPRERGFGGGGANRGGGFKPGGGNRRPGGGPGGGNRGGGGFRGGR